MEEGNGPLLTLTVLTHSYVAKNRRISETPACHKFERSLVIKCFQSGDFAITKLKEAPMKILNNIYHKMSNWVTK